MLGDTGANLVGAAVGMGAVLACDQAATVVMLVALVVLNAASEGVSFAGSSTRWARCAGSTASAPWSGAVSEPGHK